ncbi:hypothetical protein L6452_36530 [Arctium lappa]|uniref:Uncharacterized protein n=1 Tax=Arctium lappa TaxID=4217 RepID=A0ACB8YA42_ARCLA|nr:hypothetical protein L6452_36530 [Arctium lappa]
MEDSRLATGDIFSMNEIFLNDVVRSSKTVPTAGVDDCDGLRMDSSEAFAGDDDLNRVGDRMDLSGAFAGDDDLNRLFHETWQRGYKTKILQPGEHSMDLHETQIHEPSTLLYETQIREPSTLLYETQIHEPSAIGMHHRI